MLVDWNLVGCSGQSKQKSAPFPIVGSLGRMFKRASPASNPNAHGSNTYRMLVTPSSYTLPVPSSLDVYLFPSNCFDDNKPRLRYTSQIEVFAMHSTSSLVGYRDDEYYQLGLAMSYQMQPKYDGTWTPIDPTLYSFHYDQQQKQSNPDYTQFHIPNTSYQSPTIPMTEAMVYNGHVAGWHAPMDSYKDLRYDSPNGHFGGSISEASSDYTFSPEVTRQQMTLSSTRYISPPTESQFSQQTWASNSSYMLTPTSTPLSVQTPSVAMRELEFPSHPEFQLDSQEDDIRTQVLVNAPEELESTLR